MSAAFSQLLVEYHLQAFAAMGEHIPLHTLHSTQHPAPGTPSQLPPVHHLLKDGPCQHMVHSPEMRGPEDVRGHSLRLLARPGLRGGNVSLT